METVELKTDDKLLEIFYYEGVPKLISINKTRNILVYGSMMQIDLTPIKSVMDYYEKYKSITTEINLLPKPTTQARVEMLVRYSIKANAIAEAFKLYKEFILDHIALEDEKSLIIRLRIFSSMISQLPLRNFKKILCDFLSNKAIEIFAKIHKE